MAANDPGQPPLTVAAPAGAWSCDLAVPSIALAIGAHPDDVEFGAGATLAKWAAAGCVVHHLVLTDGSKGTWDPDANTASLVVLRQAEQREAARRLAGANAGTVTFLGAIDGELDNGAENRSEVVRCIRMVQPEVVVGHDPWKRYRLHPDHRHAGLLTCDGIVAARDPHFNREHGLAPHRPRTLLLFEADTPDHYEDVTDTVGHKLHALEAHTSQFESTMHATNADQITEFRERIRRRLADLGAPHSVGAAEIFKRIDDL